MTTYIIAAIAVGFVIGVFTGIAAKRIADYLRECAEQVQKYEELDKSDKV